MTRGNDTSPAASRDGHSLSLVRAFLHTPDSINNVLVDFVKRIANFAGGLAIIGTACRLAARTGWPFELASHFVAIYSIALIFALPFALHQRFKKRAALYLLALIICATDLQPLFSYTGFIPRDHIRLSILSANVKQDSLDADRLCRLINAENPDIICLSEATPTTVAGLKQVLVGYPHRLEAPTRGCLGILFYSRLPCTVTIRSHGRVPAPFITGTVTLEGGHEIGVWFVHVWPPVSPRMKRVRDDQLLGVADEIRLAGGDSIMIGDMNVSCFSPDFERLLARSGLSDSGRGFGFSPTWPVNVPLFWTMIDHVLISSEVGVLSRISGPAIGSDHFPVIVRLAIPRRSPSRLDPGGPVSRSARGIQGADQG